MKEFSSHEYYLIVRALRILQWVLSGREAAKCNELAEYFESMFRLSREDGE
jgi:hypothetical protein